MQRGAPDTFQSGFVDLPQGIPGLDKNNRITWTSDTDGQITMRKAGKEVLWLMSSSESLNDSALQLLTDFNN